MAPSTQAQEVEVPTVLTATVGFARKVNLKQYENTEASVFVQTSYPLDAPSEAVEAQLMAAFESAKLTVYTQLGIAAQIDDNGVVREAPADLPRPRNPVTDAFPDAQPVDTPAPQAPQQTSTRPARMPAVCPGTKNRDGRQVKDSCGGVEFYDNTAKKASGEFKANSPDFKCKGCGAGVWPK